MAELYLIKIQILDTVKRKLINIIINKTSLFGRLVFMLEKFTNNAKTMTSVAGNIY